MVAVFNSYTMLFIVVLLTVLTRSPEFYSFSIANIAFKFTLCELDARLHVSEVTLLEYFIAPCSSYLTTLKTASRIFTLGNGILLLSLKLVMVLLSSV